MGKRLNQKELASLSKRYRDMLSKELDLEVPEVGITQPVESREYKQFKREVASAQMTTYEKLCGLSEKILKVNPGKKDLPKLQEAIETAHLNITPAGASSLAILFPMLYVLFGIMISLFFSVLFAGPEWSPPAFFIIFFIFSGIAIMIPLQKLPYTFATDWRLKASSQMVLCIFYMVTYMRHTSNLENAVDFASNHISGPLGLDLRKVLWDVETGRYDSLKESMETYLKKWRGYNLEFIEAFHLIESSLYETSETRRVSLLDKSLDVMLEETYEKMLHYAHNLKSPMTTLHMLGIILPILGLVILPLAVNFLEGIRWYHLAVLYNIVLPISVFYLGRNILNQRPTGYGEVDISEQIPGLKKYGNVILNLGKSEIQIKPSLIAGFIFVCLIFIAFIPLMLHMMGAQEVDFLGADSRWDLKLLEYKEDKNGKLVGPFGLADSLFSMFFPLSLGISLGLYYKFRSQNLMKIRDSAKKLEQEFASALFQLGNRLGDGIPAEIAFDRVSTVMEGTVSGKFFDQVSTNIRKLGMSVNDAIFNPKNGAILYFPSRIIESSMKVLSQAIEKGPRIAAQALINISRYIKEMHRVDERLKDLLADIIASMKSQIAMLTPAIAGIVIGITSMITNILGKLGPVLDAQGGDFNFNQDFFQLGIPTYFFQMIVGIYVVQIVYILTILSNGIENGADSLNERYLLGKNLIRSTLIYVFIAATVMIIFSFIADEVLKKVLAESLG